ncbi:hypothetical protein F8388_008581 [Cannabis sativa]|uniref:Mon2/Sec7/BIG1-like dimerisation and cyclophilin-binding domain-containing protein n=1 Tax=Cannabis sativa TaxID=3483 RepID=A0A7J6FLQ2_CANSA|nr:hypothetical protein F8388_008581 [Cannabis sativa]KAF4403798.1 hypothetical protein G4B88_002651 [Cannabis sativa]
MNLYHSRIEAKYKGANSEGDTSGLGPLHDGGSTEYSLADSESILSPLINAASSDVLKIADPVVDCVQKLIAHGYLRGEADPSGEAEGKLLSKLIESVCKCHDLGDDQMELAIVKTCYDIHFGSKNVVNQTTAKASLIQMLVIVFRRMEADSSTDGDWRRALIYCDKELPTSITNLYLTSDLASLSKAVLISSILISSISAVMSCLAQKSSISCVSFIPPISLPPTIFLPVLPRIAIFKK